MKFSLLLAVIPFVIALSASASDFDFEKVLAEIEKSEIKLVELFNTGYARWENNNHLILGKGANKACTQIGNIKVSNAMGMAGVSIKSDGLICISGTDFNNGVSVHLKLKGKEAIIRAYELSSAN